MAGGDRDPAGRRRRSPGPGDQQRHPGGLVEGVAPLLHQAAVGAEQVAVVGGEHHDGVVGHARRLEGTRGSGRWPGRRACAGSSRGAGSRGRWPCSKIIWGQTALNSSWQAGRPANESAWDGASGIVGHGVVRRAELRATAPSRIPTKAMSWGLTNEATASHGPVGAGRGQLAEQLDHLLGEHAVAHRAAVGLGRAVGLTTDPAREPERVEPIGLAVGLDRLGDRAAVVVGGHQAFVGPGDGEVGVARRATCPGSGSGSRRPGTSRPASGPSPGRASPCPGRRPAWPSRRSATPRAATGTGR